MPKQEGYTLTLTGLSEKELEVLSSIAALVELIGSNRFETAIYERNFTLDRLNIKLRWCKDNLLRQDGKC